MKLKDVADIKSGFLFARRKEAPNGKEYRVLSLKDSLDSNKLDYNHLDNVKLDDVNEKYLAKPGQIVLKCKGNNHTAYLIDNNVPNNLLITSYYFILDVKNDNLLPEFLCFYLNKPEIQDRFKKLSRGTSIFNLTISAVADTDIKIPSLDSQRKITELNELSLDYTSKLHQLADSYDVYYKNLINKIERNANG